MSRDAGQASTVQKEQSMVLQKQLIGDYYESLGRAREEGGGSFPRSFPGI